VVDAPQWLWFSAPDTLIASRVRAVGGDGQEALKSK
jgi:hypothetical protein